MKRRVISIIVLTLTLLSITCAVYADEGILEATLTNIKVTLDGARMLNEVVIIDGTSYLPLRTTANLLGIDAEWDNDNREIHLKSNKSFYAEPMLTNLSTNSYIANVKYVYDNGTVYEGQLRNGVYHGKDNKIVFPDGTVYQGDFINGVIHGQGKYTAINGDIYEGSFENNQYKGYGKYTYVNGDVIEGEFDGDKLAKDTVVYVRYKATNEKDYIKSKKWDREIKGVDTYSFNFDHTKYNGTADVVFSNGTRYVGSISNNTFNGQGTIFYPNGDTYKGNWVSNQKTGKGKYTYYNNTVYDGYFLNNKYEGEGKFYYANGDIYDGTWKDGKRHGYGVYKYANGNEFRGEWQDDVKHTLKQDDGYGTYIVDGKNSPKLDGKDVRYKQKWNKGKLVREARD